MSDLNYNQNFFITPFYIANLPGMTLSYLRVYEIIFQFWNKGRTCFLSNPTIHERTGVCLTQIKEALNFFENLGELKRVTKGTRRYLIQPERAIEHDCPENEQQVAPPAWGGRSTDLEQVAPPATEIKNLNKEDKKTTTVEQPQSSSSFFSLKQQTQLLTLKLPSDDRTKDLFLKHCQHHIENQENNLGRFQRISGLTKILTGCYESGEYFNAKGFDKTWKKKIASLKIPTEDDFRRHEENKPGYEWVETYIQSMYQLNSLPTQEYYQMGNFGAKGYGWVKTWMEIKGLNKKQK